jgi:zinc transporter
MGNDRRRTFGHDCAMDEIIGYDNADLDGPMLFGRVLDGKGGARAIGWDDAKGWEPQEPGEILWVHLRCTEPGIAEWFESALHIPATTARLLLLDDTRPRAFREGNALVAILRGINFNPGAEPEDMISMQLWCDGTRLVTLRSQKLQTPRETLAQVDGGSGPRDAGALITSLVERMIARMNSSIVDMNDHIDVLEKSDPDEDIERKLGKIASIRRNCLALQRYMSPQHEALGHIARDAPGWFEEHDRREIAETIDRLRRYLDDLDISKESALVLQDEVRARAVANTDRTSYLLTIVAAIFLPLGFLTGLLGINVGGMPGVDNPEAFWAVVGLCGAILVMQLALFWRWKWF